MVELERHIRLKILYIRNAMGSNPILPTIFYKLLWVGLFGHIWYMPKEEEFGHIIILFLSGSIPALT